MLFRSGHYDKPIEPKIDINFFTDTHYLPTTYWENNNINSANIPVTSTTTFNLSNLIIGNAVNIVDTFDMSYRCQY